ncbi:MAG: hypothetical protein JNL01_06175 [Bdellovibrionales bacterium]|nr:hypothetical protein [Bdellovibrionales bacterium]
MKLNFMRWTTSLFLLFLSPSAFAGFADLVCKTPKYEFRMKATPQIAPNAVTIEVHKAGAAPNSTPTATFVGKDSTDPHESSWPIIHGNIKAPFTFYGQTSGQGPVKLVWGKKDLTRKAVCTWKYQH